MTIRQIPLYKVHMPEEASDAIREILLSGQIAHGPNVSLFETKLQNFIGNSLVTTTKDVSTSIEMSLYMAGVRPMDEVLTSPMACLATTTPVLNLFAKVRWVDVELNTGNISPNDLESQISASTKAILIYHWAGNPVDLDSIYLIAQKNGLKVVEDAGEALGATYHGRKIGNTGTDFTVFSFHAIRHITTCDGAAIAFREPVNYERGQWLKRYGIHQPTFRDSMGEINPASDVTDAGYNSYMNHVEATIGIIQMAYLEKIVEQHYQNGCYFDETLNDIPGISIIKRQPKSRSAYWVYTLLAERRDDLMKYLREHGVYASKVHLRNDIYSCFGPNQRNLPGVDYFDDHYLSIPSGWWVTKDDREMIGDLIRKGW
jgi:perosamine synthetase